MKTSQSGPAGIQGRRNCHVTGSGGRHFRVGSRPDVFGNRVQLGPVDIIVANATCEQPLKPIEEYD